MSEEEKIFKTTDLFLSVFLKYIGYELSSVEQNGGKTVFMFKDDENREKNVLDYFNKKPKVDPLGFSQSYKDIKGILFNTHK